MRTYKDIDTFSDWTNEEQNQFSLAVNDSSQVKGVAKRSCPPGFTRSGKRLSKRLGSGKRQSKLAA